jgi:hypothetical protein
MSDTLDLVINQGSTFKQVLRWATTPIIYKPITGATKAAPCVITVVAHGVPDGWPVALAAVGGMTQLNAKNTPAKNSDYRRATLRDANTIELNDVNAAAYSTYTSGGFLQYDTPTDLAGFTARMSIKDKIGGALLLSLTDANNRIQFDNVLKTITLSITAADTAAIAWAQGVYDLELVSAAGVVTRLFSGSVAINFEVTT